MYNKIKYMLKLSIYQKKWRKKNSHNLTTIQNIFNIDTVKVGKESYGPITVHTWGAENEGLEIGNFVSIAKGVEFILGGNHYYNTFSTYPFKVLLNGEIREAYSNGRIIIGDDVWIGMNCIIMSGVSIGKGAIIAAGSVVTKNVPPYTIVGGNPARHIKDRFPKEIADQLIRYDFSALEPMKIVENIDLVYKPLKDKNDVFKLLNILSNGE